MLWLLSSLNSSSIVILFLSCSLAQLFVPMFITQTLFLPTIAAFLQCHSHASCPLSSISSLSGQPCVGPISCPSSTWCLLSSSLLRSISIALPPWTLSGHHFFRLLLKHNPCHIHLSIYPHPYLSMSVTGEKHIILTRSHFKFMAIDLNGALKYLSIIYFPG